MKKLICLLMSLISAVLFVAATGCGSEDGYPVEEGATIVKIMMREFEEWRNNQFSAAVRSFNEDLTDGIQVEVEYVIESSFDDRLTTAREAGKAPDIILHSYNHIYTQVDNGNICSIDDYLSAPAVNDVKDLVKPAIQFDGKLYAYPWYTEASTVLFYSKSIFEQAGVSKAPATWDEMLSVCGKIKSVLGKGKYALGMPLGGDIGWATWGMVYNQLGGWPVTDNWNKSIFDETPSKLNDFSRLLDYYFELYDNGYTPISPLHANGYNEIITAWAEGKYAMTFAVSSQLGTLIQEYPETLSDVGIAVMPTENGNAESVTSTNGGWCFCIDAQSSHKAEAGKVIEALMYSDAEKSAEFFDMSGYSRIPALKSVEKLTSERALNSEYKAYSDLIKGVCDNAVMEPIYTWNISLQVQWGFENMITWSHSGADDTTLNIAKRVRNKINEIIEISEMSGKNPNYQAG